MNASFSDLENKHILVTGATRGIGKAIAESLAKQKCRLVFNYREGKEELADKFAHELKELGATSAQGIMFDLTQFDQMKEAVEKYTKEHGQIEGLVNNAGLSKDGLMLRLKPADLDMTLNTNLRGAILLTQVLTRGFLRVTNPSIVNISSIVGLMGNAGQVAYSASKAGLIGFSKSYAKEMGSKGIRSNVICPGFIETDMTGELDPKVKDEYLSSITLKRFGSTEEVANLVNFLLSGASSYITGETIKIDGGLYI